MNPATTGMYSKFPDFLKSPKTARLIGAPMSHGQPISGTDRGPQLLRLAGLENALKSLDWTVVDDGDLNMMSLEGSPQSPGIPKNLESVAHGNSVLYDAVKDAVNASEFPVVMGGDHSVALGSVAAVLKARPETGIIWVDAHADINTPITSPSGNMHGMPVSFLMKLEGTQGFDELQWMKDVPTLKPDQIAYVGLRDIDEDERNVLRQSGIESIFTMHEVDKYGISRVMEEVLGRLEGRPLHVSYDVDAVDPMFAPATGTVVRGGLTYREAFYVAESIAETGMLGSVDMVEVNPLLASGEEANETVKLGLRLIEALLGGRLYEPQTPLS